MLCTTSYGMDIRELKQLLKNSSSVLVLDNGEPAYVILDYGVYRNLTGDKEKEIRINYPAVPEMGNGSFEGGIVPPAVQASLSPQEMEAIERLNKEIQALKEQIEADQGSEVF